MVDNKKYVELIWAEKYAKFDKGEKIPIEKPNLPVQVVETINKPRIKGGITAPLFPEDEWPEEYPKDWKNLLIWGDNKLVMSSLIKQGWAGKINLIYIDPPFFTGTDFTIRTRLGDEQIEKAPSIIEERAYSDTWSGGIASYLRYMYERLVLMRELLSENGSIYVHIDWHVGHYVKVMMDEIFGYENFVNEALWADFMAVSSQSDELLSFDTQKPEALLNRIILASSNPGDIVADFFCGSGTTLATAEKLGRRWLGCDLSKFAIQVTRNKMLTQSDGGCEYCVSSLLELFSDKFPEYGSIAKSAFKEKFGMALEDFLNQNPDDVRR